MDSRRLCAIIARRAGTAAGPAPREPAHHTQEEAARHDPGPVRTGLEEGAAATAATAYDRRTTGTLIDDETIELKLLDALKADNEVWEQTHINGTSYNNILLLTGEAPSETLRQRVAAIGAGIRKVREVHNEIRVAAPSSLPSRSSDAWVTSKVKTAMINADEVDSLRIKVVTEAGVVYLMGLVSRAEADAATDVARRVGGVQRVVKVFEYTD